MVWVAAGGPDAVAHSADYREQVLGHAEDPAPPTGDLDRSAGELFRIRLEPSLNAGGHLFPCRPLFVDLQVSKAAEDEPEIRCLLPVVVPVARVMGAGVELLAERRGHDDLAPCRADCTVQLIDETLCIAVGRNDHLLGVEIVERRNPVVLPDLRTGLGAP